MKIRWSCFLLLFIIPNIPGLSRFSEEAMFEEIEQWCVMYPYGIIYSHGNYYDCESVDPDEEERFVRSMLLKKVKLRLGFITGKSGYDYDCRSEDGIRLGESYSQYIVNLLREILQFETELVAVDTWGVFDEVNKNWTGLVGLAVSNNIDLGVCHVTVTEERENAVDFLLSTLSSSRSFVYDPSQLSLTRDVLVQTFPPMLWLCFFVSVALLVLCFRFSTWLHSTLRPDHEPWSWVEIIMWANAAICQQSYSRHPKGSSCRTTFLIGYLITYLLYTGFAAGITSLLAVQGHDIQLGFKDVLLMKLKLVLQWDGTNLDFVKNSPDLNAKALHSSMYDLLEQHKVDSVQELFSKIRNRNFIGLGTTVTILNYVRRKIFDSGNDFTVSQIPNSNHQKAFLLPKRSHYKEIFNFWLLRLLESGLLDFGIKKYIHIDETNLHQRVGWSSAGLGNVFSAVVILCGGLFFSVVILFFEIAWKRRSTVIGRRTNLAN